MAAELLSPAQCLPAPVEKCDGLRYIARQPILDLRGRVHGYELLFRNGPEAVFRGDGDLATRTMLDNTVIFGLEKLTGGITAFVNCTRESLTDRLVEVLPPSMFVLEILESIEPTPELVNACRRLKEAGFRLALDDFTWRPGFDPLVELADYIKVDFTLSNSMERKQLMRRLRSVTVAMIAEKIETQEDYTQACGEGFTLIQGYYFCRPQLMGNRKVPANRLSHLEILRMLAQEPMDLQKLTVLVKRDASLTYRLLRLVNSPLTAMRQEVRSVEGAMLAIGADGFRRVATLAITTELNLSQSVELLRMALMRARFCELAARLCGLDSTEQYLLGLLSLLPAMLGVSMEELTRQLPLREDVCLALLGAGIPERRPLEWLMWHEKGDWSACDEIAETNHLNQLELLQSYSAAVVWAEAAFYLR